MMTGRLHYPTSHWLLSLLFLCLIYSTTVYADTNVTLDDGDKKITYSPTSAWTRNPPSPLDHGGSHMLTQTPGATATFKFTGTAIYFLAPLWPYHVTTQVSLDSASPTLLDLVDHSQPDRGGGPETVRSTVVWYQTDLENTDHILQISVGAGEPYAIVDGLIYTKSSHNTAPSPIPSDNAAPPPIPSETRSTNSALSWATNHVKLIVGVGVGVGVLLLIVVVWLLWPKKKPLRHAEVNVKVPV